VFDASPPRLPESLEYPFGYLPRFEITENRTQKETTRKFLLNKGAWDAAKSPSKNIPMTLFMLWMIGNSVHIFSLLVTVYSLINPVTAILQLKTVFEKYEGNESLILQKLVYILLNLLIISFAVYKCWSLGLLPTASDWAAFLSVKQMQEFSAGGLIFSQS